MGWSLLDELLDEARHDESFVARDRAMLLDLDLVTHLELVLLVVGFEARPRPHVLAVERIASRRDDFDGHSLGHFVPDDLTDHATAATVHHALFGCIGGRRRRCCLARLAHLIASPCSVFAVLPARFLAETFSAGGVFAVSARGAGSRAFL